MASSNEFYENPALKMMISSVGKIFSSEVLGNVISPATLSFSLNAMTAGQTDFTTPVAGYIQIAASIIPSLLFGFTIPLLGTVLGGFAEGIWGNNESEKIRLQLQPLEQVGKERRDAIVNYLNATLPDDSEMVENWVKERKLVDGRILTGDQHSGTINYVFTPGETHIFNTISKMIFNPLWSIPTGRIIDKLYLYQVPYEKLTDREKEIFQVHKDAVKESFIYQFNLSQEGMGVPSEYGAYHPKQLEKEVLSEMGLLGTIYRTTLVIYPQEGIPYEVEGEEMWASRWVTPQEGPQYFLSDSDIPPQHYWDDTNHVNPLILELAEISKMEAETIIPEGVTTIDIPGGVTMTDTQFITSLYQNIIRREPDTEGLAYWIDDYVASGRDQEGTLKEFIAGAQYAGETIYSTNLPSTSLMAGFPMWGWLVLGGIGLSLIGGKKSHGKRAKSM